MVDPSVCGPLRSELGRVEELVRHLRLLPGGQPELPEPVRVAEVLPAVIELLRRHRGLEDLRVEVEAVADPLIRVRWSTLIRILLLLLAAQGRAALAAGSDEVMVRIGNGEGVAVIELGVLAAVAAGAGGDDGEGGEPGDGEARSVVADAGGTLTTSGSGATLSFPLFGV
jgi:hypothetical protein